MLAAFTESSRDETGPGANKLRLNWNPVKQPLMTLSFGSTVLVFK
jgi:hypothetical protein